MEQNVNSTRVVTNEVILSYPHLFVPYSNQPGQTPKYSTTILIPKSDVLTKQKIDAAIQAAIQNGLAKSWNGVKPPMVPTPLHDGDGVRPSDGAPFPQECKGHWVMTASANADHAPQVVDAQLNPIMNQSEIYAGVKARVSFSFFAYNAHGRKGIGCGLNNVQKIADGTPLVSRANAEDDFTPIQGQMPQQNMQQPQNQMYGQQMPQQNMQQPQNQMYGQQMPQQNMQQPQNWAPGGGGNYGNMAQQQNIQQPQHQLDPITGQPMIPGMGY